MRTVNPVLPMDEFVPDGEPRVFGKRLYLFGSHEKSHGTAFCTEDYVCWSASVENLEQWRYEGVIYRKEQDPMNQDGSHCMYAPDVVQGVDGRYYLYYALDTVGKISVAVCDTPAGKYEFYGMVCKRLPDGTEEALTDYFLFDPGVLVDNGRVFLYYGFCPGTIDKKVPMLSNEEGSLVCELEEDMKTLKVEPKFLIPSEKKSKGTSFEGHGFFEASSIRKVNGLYYFIYSSILSHELCYAVSDEPDQGFVFGGTLISNGDIGFRGREAGKRVAFTGNTHGSIVKVKEQWYVFYHRHTQATWCCRQACAEKISIGDDGSIAQVELTSCGLNKEALPTEGAYSAAICCNLVSKEGAFHIDPSIEREVDFVQKIPYVTEEQGEGIIVNIQNGTQIGYKYFNFMGEEKELLLEMRGQGNGELRVYIDGSSMEWITGQKGEEISNTKIDISEKKWKWKSTKINKTKGVHSLYFSYEGTGKLDFKNICFV